MFFNSVINDFKKFYPVNEETPKKVVKGVTCGFGIYGLQKISNGIFEIISQSSTPAKRKLQTVKGKDFFLKGIIAPIVEEALFRGYYKEIQQKRVVDRSDSHVQLKNNIESSFLFTICHFSKKEGIKVFIKKSPGVFVSALALSYIVDNSSSLIEATVGHSVNNFIILLRNNRFKPVLFK